MLTNIQLLLLKNIFNYRRQISLNIYIVTYYISLLSNTEYSFRPLFLLFIKITSLHFIYFSNK